MKTILFFLLLCMITYSQVHHKEETILPVPGQIETIQLITEKLELMEKKYLTKLSYRDYTRAKNILIDIHNLVHTLVVFEEEYIPEIPLPMDDISFRELYNTIKNESFEADQLTIVETAAIYNYFTIKQLIELLELFPFSNGRIKLVREFYPNVIDKQNSPLLINAFTYSSEKEMVREIINYYR